MGTNVQQRKPLRGNCGVASATASRLPRGKMPHLPFGPPLPEVRLPAALQWKTTNRFLPLRASVFAVVFLALFLSLCAADASAAAFSPLQIGAVWDTGETAAGEIVEHGFRLVSRDTPVIGLRLNLPYADNETVGGLDMGLVSVSETFSGIRLNVYALSSTVNGIALGLIDATDHLNGIQIAPFAFAGDFRGIQAGLLSVSRDNGGPFCGIQLGIGNFAEDLRGIQVGLFNNGVRFFGSTGSVRGVQLGFFNSTPDLRGLQIGILNFAENLRGVQIGILNSGSEDDIPLPLLRASF